MRTLCKHLLAVSLLLVGVSASFAQTKEAKHDTIADYYKKAKEHIAKIKSSNSKDQEANKMHAEEATKNLAKAKAKHKEMKDAMPAQYNQIATPHYVVIEKYHTEADKNAGNLTQELEKSDYNVKKAKEHAAYFYTDVTNAEKEHQKLQGDVSFK